MEKLGFFFTVLVWLALVLLGGAVLVKSARGQSNAVNACISALVFDINHTLMSNTTARRKARVICYDIQYKDPSFYKALTQ